MHPTTALPASLFITTGVAAFWKGHCHQERRREFAMLRRARIPGRARALVEGRRSENSSRAGRLSHSGSPISKRRLDSEWPGWRETCEFSTRAARGPRGRRRRHGLGACRGAGSGAGPAPSTRRWPCVPGGVMWGAALEPGGGAGAGPGRAGRAALARTAVTRWPGLSEDGEHRGRVRPAGRRDVRRSEERGFFPGVRRVDCFC